MPTPHGNYGGTFLVSGCQYCGNVIRKEFEKGQKNSKIQKLNDLEKQRDSKRSDSIKSKIYTKVERFKDLCRNKKIQIKSTIKQKSDP